MRVAVIGAGPMGIAAAIGAADRGHEVTVLERDAVGTSLRSWGPTRFFSPLEMNVSAGMREILGGDMPPGDALLTGAEYVTRVLEPLVVRPPLAGRVRTESRVLAVGRRGLTRGDFADHPLRGERPFRLLVAFENETGRHEEYVEADAVLDASGGLVVPRAFGAGGLPPRGLPALTQKPIRTLGGLDAAREDLRGKRVLLVGSGHSAANALLMLETLAAETPETRVIWAVRFANRSPCEAVANDPLPERARVVSRANALAQTPPPFLTIHRRAAVEAVEQNGDEIVVSLSGGRAEAVDVIAAFTGYRPDIRPLDELTLELSPITEGGGRLYQQISRISDCLSTPKLRPEDLESGEPRFYLVGSRSYGSSGSFLLRTGLAQLETILSRL